MSSIGVRDAAIAALDIIQAEHRGIWRIAGALDALRDAMARRQEANAAAATAIDLLDYLDLYADRVHHPKEDEYLFRVLRNRDAAAAAQIDRLEAEHRDGPHHLAQLRKLASDYAEGNTDGEQTFFNALAHYTEHLRSHIRFEETTVMPAARRALSPEDWKSINASFLDNDDPLFGAKARAEFAALKARIVALAPEPVGLGGSRSAAAGRPMAIAAAARTALEIRGVTSHYGRIQALHGIDLEIKEGQLVALVGANGAGKTTLLRTISGVQRASGGEIRLFGQDITRLAPERRVKLGICQVPEGRQVFGPMSIEDNLRLGAYTRRGNGVGKDLERMYALFPMLREKRLLPAGALSGGQQQMLAMARAMMGAPRLLLLDEPSMGLAPLLVEEVFRVVKRLRAEGMTIFLVEQNAHAALSIADVGYVIETGHTILSGPGLELLHNEQVKQAYLGM
jgi:branched-chain amino acid transport system ATP-binding protein